jgi:molybdopterin-guanine dinucleotide biosynthesis protein A
VSEQRDCDVTGVVLCGGRARRMGGVDKPLLRLGTESVLKRILLRLEPQLGRILLSCNRLAERYEGFGLPIVADARRDAGPLAGVEAALSACRTPLLLVWPGDAPDLPTDIVATLVGALGDADAAVVEADGEVQNLCLLLRQDCLAELTRWLDDGGRKAQEWLATRRVQVVAVPGSFSNLNSPEDVRAFQRRHEDTYSR